MHAALKKFITKSVYLLPALPVIFFFIHHLNQYRELILTIDIFFLFLVYTSVAYFIFFIIRKAFKKSIPFAGVTSSVFILFFLFFGILQDAFYHSKNLQFLSNSALLLFLTLVMFVSAWFIFKKKPAATAAACRYFILLFTSLILMETGLFIYKMKSGQSIGAIAKRMGATPVNGLIQPPNARPDIYYIIFDSYTNRPALLKHWNYDNEIYPFLESRGFFTIDSGFSNYKSTPFSISSVMNLQYLAGAEDYLVSNSFNFLIGQNVYDNNRLYRFLKNHGYQFSVFSQLHDKNLLTGFGFLGVEKPIKWIRKLTMERVYIDPWMQDKLKRWLGRKTDQVAVKLKSMETFAEYNQNAIQHIRTECLKNTGINSGVPIFSFTHFMLPHDPYLFDEDGNRVANAEPGGAGMAGYLGQVKYSNKLIREITDCLLSDTTRNKVIIFQGDHGFRHYSNAPAFTQFEALNAVYFYNTNYSGLKKNMSHVNTFRVVLNNVFGLELPLLADSIVMKRNE